MSITEAGIAAEKKARRFLNSIGIKNIQQLDWLVKIKDTYYAIEVKDRELFKPPPFIGTGLDISQLKRRCQLYLDKKIDTILLVFDKDTDFVYYQKLSILEKTVYFDTKNGIRIYDINEFIQKYFKEV